MEHVATPDALVRTTMALQFLVGGLQFIVMIYQIVILKRIDFFT